MPSAPSAKPIALQPSARGWMLALAVIVLATHGRDIFNEFVNWDDGSLVLQNAVLNPVSWANLGKIWSGPVEQLYSPLAYTLWSVTRIAATLQTPDSQGVSLNPMVFHAVNVLLHVGSVLIIFDLLRKLTQVMRDRRGVIEPSPLLTPATRDGDRPVLIAAFFGAAIFGVHPINVEAVAWISGMNNCLAGLFSLATIDAYLHAATGGRRRTYAVALSMFLLALLAKPTAIITPLMILLIDWLLLDRRWRAIAKSLWPMAMLAVPFVVIGSRSQPAVEIYAPPLPQRVLVAADSIGFYITKLFAPLRLTIDYGRTPERVLWLTWWPATATLTICALMMAAVWWPRSRTPAAVIGLWIAGVAIVSGITPFNFQAYSTVTDRYLYLSMLAPAMAVSLVLLRSPTRLARSIAGAVTALLIGLSLVQGTMWADGDTLAKQAIARNPTSLVGFSVLGYNAEARGDPVAQEYWFRRGLSIYPGDNTLTYNLANLLLVDRPEQAIVYYQRAYTNGYREHRLLNNWGVALLKLGRLRQAIDAFRASINVNPVYISARANLVRALVQDSELDQADRECRELLRIAPGNVFASETLTKLAAFRASGSGSPGTIPLTTRAVPIAPPVPDDFR